MRLATMTLDRYAAVIAVLLLGSCILRADNSAHKANGPIRIGGTYRVNHPVVKEWVKAFLAGHKELDGQFKVSKWYRHDNILRFAKNNCDVLVHYRPLTEMEQLILMWKFPKKHLELATFLAGQAKVIVIANRLNKIERLTTKKAQRLLTYNQGRKPLWHEVGGDGGEIASYGERKQSWSRHIVWDHFLRIKTKDDTERLYTSYRKDFTTCHDATEVIEKVRKDRGGIGFILYRGGPIDRVKILAIGKDAKGPFVTPKLGPWIQEDYPLSEPLILYLHPKASPLAKKFCEFAVSEEGAKIAAKHGLITPWHERQYEGELRLKEMKAGKGVQLSASGVQAGKEIMPVLAAEYVRAKEVVRLSYAAVRSDVAAVGGFVAGGKGKRELLVLDDKPSERAFELHGRKWNALGADGTGPAEHVLAGRAAAVIVNPVNKLESLTLGQMQSIFGGEVKDWTVIGTTGLAAGSTSINAFRLSPRDPATKLFQTECMGKRKFVRAKRLKDTAAAVAAVGMDPRAIAYVDLAAIPATGQAVKVLAIRIGKGKKAKAIHPTPQNIKNAMYPLSRRLYLYVNPKASDTAKRYAAFLASCGGSTSSPYSDTVKSVIAIYRKHGLIPLADAPITRMMKDAMAEAAKRAAAKRK